MPSLSRLSTEYVQVQVTFTVDGVSANPTGDAVQMAFMQGGAIPANTDWHSATWHTSGSTYFAQCLVGPANGGISLNPGNYNVWLKVTDSPEIPVWSPDRLAIL